MLFQIKVTLSINWCETPPHGYIELGSFPATILADLRPSNVTSCVSVRVQRLMLILTAALSVRYYVEYSSSMRLLGAYTSRQVHRIPSQWENILAYRSQDDVDAAERAYTINMTHSHGYIYKNSARNKCSCLPGRSNGYIREHNFLRASCTCPLREKQRACQDD